MFKWNFSLSLSNKSQIPKAYPHTQINKGFFGQRYCCSWVPQIINDFKRYNVWKAWWIWWEHFTVDTIGAHTFFPKWWVGPPNLVRKTFRKASRSLLSVLCSWRTEHRCPMQAEKSHSLWHWDRSALWHQPFLPIINCQDKNCLISCEYFLRAITGPPTWANMPGNCR